MLYFEGEKHILTLSELNNLIKDSIEITMPNVYWVKAELASVRESRGHCYMELIEKEDSTNFRGDGIIAAQARACCWQNTWTRLSPKFQNTTGEPLRAGMSVLLCVKANFHISFGFSWIVLDIDPTFTMGDMARRRQEIIKQLKKEGVFDLNKQLRLSPFAKRIAVISSATAAGYGDFCNQLHDNEYGFMFETRLFAATMQGTQVEHSIINALEEIYENLTQFDAVVIIRGGGSTTDLSCFDSLALAENVANFPLPVITGIGHDRDQSIIDLIACHSMKTPTAVAAFLIDNLADTLERINDYARHITDIVQRRMETERMNTHRIEQYLSSAFAIRKEREYGKINELSSKMASAMSRRLLIESKRIEAISLHLPMTLTNLQQRERHRLDILEQRAHALDPVHILKRGYSIAMFQGKAVTDASQLKVGDELTLVMAKGEKNVKVCVSKKKIVPLHP